MTNGYHSIEAWRTACEDSRRRAQDGRALGDKRRAQHLDRVIGVTIVLWIIILVVGLYVATS